jgi:uncharacterized OB-fold protein
MEIGFDYTRSLGPVLGAFLTGLAGRRILGSRASDGRVHVPPLEYDPHTHAPTAELVEVADEGTVVTWSWTGSPGEGQPLASSFAWALIRLDGADTSMLHAVDAAHGEMRTGMRVRARFADAPVGSIRDIVCFIPSTLTAPSDPAGGEVARVSMTTTPIHLRYEHYASPEESRYLRALEQGRLLGQRCPSCRKVYVPPRGACPTCGVPTSDDVPVAATGTITTFCIVNVPFPGQRTKPPYVHAAVLLDGADIPFQHLILGCPADEVRMGMRVRAVWRPRDEWGPTPQNISHFEPTDEPDADFHTYESHL